MAVTIEEMHVEVQEPPPAASGPASDAESKKEINLAEAMNLLRERKLRLNAD